MGVRELPAIFHQVQRQLFPMLEDELGWKYRPDQPAAGSQRFVVYPKPRRPPAREICGIAPTVGAAFRQCFGR